MPHANALSPESQDMNSSLQSQVLRLEAAGEWRQIVGVWVSVLGGQLQAVELVSSVLNNFVSWAKSPCLQCLQDCAQTIPHLA